ncbi:MAG: InlB B-repeat-containing protein [Treponema sp.]|nr:InlB B-repeat-containing protein [Treponema sp.]
MKKNLLVLSGSVLLIAFSGLFFACYNGHAEKPEIVVVAFNIGINPGEGTGRTPPAQTVDAGTVITLPDGEGLERWGYTFGGWYAYAVIYSAGSSYTVTGNVTLNAKWNRIYSVAYDTNSGKGSTPYTEYGNVDIPVMLPDGSGLSKAGCAFGGWNTNKDGTGRNYSGGTPYVPANTITLYAKWDFILNLGDTGPGGGIVFYRNESGFTGRGRTSQLFHYLEAAPYDFPEKLEAASPGYDGIRPSSAEQSIGDGWINTNSILAQDTNAPAARACKDYRGSNDTDDWYLPSLNELVELYKRRAYVGNFGTERYCSSSNGTSSSSIWMIDFNTGSADNFQKRWGYLVRAIRAF